MEFQDRSDVPQAPPFHGHKPTRHMASAGVIYSTGAAAKLCGLSQQTIIRCFDAGKLGGFKVPGSYHRRIPRAALLAFMLDNGIPTDALGELSAEERKLVATAVGLADVIEAKLKLTTADRFGGGFPAA